MSRPHRKSALWAIGACFALALFLAPGARANGWTTGGNISTDEVIFPQLGMAADESGLAVWHEYDGCSCQTIHTAELSGGSFLAGPSLDGGAVDDHTGVRVAENRAGDVVASWGRYGDGVTRLALRPAGGAWSTPVSIAGTAPIGLGIDEAGNATAAVFADLPNQSGVGTHRAVQVVTHLAGASAWSAPVTVSAGDTSVARGSSLPAVKLAVAPDGDATLAWEPGMETSVVETSERSSAGASWSTPQASHSGHADGNVAALSLAVASGGRAAIVWGSGAYGVDNVLMVREGSGQDFGSPVETLTNAENVQVALGGDGRLTVAAIGGCSDHRYCGNAVLVETKPAGGAFGATQTVESDDWYDSLSLRADASGATALAWVSGYSSPTHLKASVLAPGESEFPAATDIGGVTTTGNIVDPALAMSGDGSAVVAFGSPPLYATYDGRQADPPTVVTGASTPGDGSGSDPQTMRVVEGSYATNACTVRGAGDGTSLRVAYEPAASFDGSHYGGATAWVEVPYAAGPATGEFTQTLSGLTPETVYHYRVEGKNECAGLTASAAGEDATFTTAGRHDGPLTFTVLANGTPFAAGTHFAQGTVVHITMDCTVPPPRSVALCEHPDALDTSRAGGPFTFTVRAADDVGRQSSTTFGYFVDSPPPAKQDRQGGPAKSTDPDRGVSPGKRGGQAIGTTQELPPAIDGSKLAGNGGAIIDIEALIPNTTLIQGSGLISDKGLGLTGGDLASMIAGNANGVIAAGGGNVIAAGGGNVIAAGGGNVIAAGGGGVIAAGGGNAIAGGGGNRPQLLVARHRTPRRGKRRQILLFDAGHRFAAPGHAKLHLRPTKQGRKLFQAYERAAKIARKHHHKVKPLKLAVTTIVGPYEVGHGVAEYATRLIKIKP